MANKISLVGASGAHHLVFIAPSIMIIANTAAVRVSQPNTNHSQINTSHAPNIVTHNS